MPDTALKNTFLHEQAGQEQGDLRDEGDQQLKLPRKVYTLTCSNECIRISNNMKQEEQVTLEWPKIPAAFRCKKAIYVYAAPTRAFILPEGQADATQDEVWAMMERNLCEGRAHNRCKKK